MFIDLKTADSKVRNLKTIIDVVFADQKASIKPYRCVPLYNKPYTVPS